MMIKPLSPREREVVVLLASGLSNREIAQALGIHRHTVKNHLTAIYDKWQINDGKQAVICALAYGLLTIAEAYETMRTYARATM